MHIYSGHELRVFQIYKVFVIAIEQLNVLEPDDLYKFAVNRNLNISIFINIYI